MQNTQRRQQVERVIVDGVFVDGGAETRPTIVRPLVRSTALFGGWGPRCW